MTINGGGLCPPPTRPKNDFKTLGKVGKGEPPFPKSVIPRSASNEGSPLMEEGYALIQLHLKLIFCRSGLVGKWAPFPIMCHPEPTLRGVSSFQWRRWTDPPPTPPKKNLTKEMSHFVRHDDKWRRNESPHRTPPIKDLKSFLGLVGKGSFPLPNMCHSELSLRGMTMLMIFCLWGKGGDPSLRSGRPNYGRLERGQSPRSTN